MKQQVHPGLIAGAVAVLALVIFGIYKLTMGSAAPVAPSSAPDYAKAAQQGRGTSMADYYNKQQQDLQQKGVVAGGRGGRPGYNGGSPGGMGR